MKTIRVSVQTRKDGSRCEREFQIHDDATDDEIHEACMEEVRKMADWGWTVVEK
jgi:hypothetical protein